MTILHLISSGGMYGAEAVILNLSRALNEAGHCSIVASFDNSAQPNLQLYEAATRADIESHAVPCNGQLDTAVPARIRSLVRDTRADIVHAHGYKADVYAWLALRNSPTALVSTCHGWIDLDVAVRVYGAIDRRLLRSFAGVVAVSDFVRQRLLSSGVSPEKVRLIDNGIDLRPFEHARHSATRSADRPLRIGAVGRLSYEKGMDVFLQAAATVLAEFPNIQFVVTGEGDDRAALESQIAALGLKDRFNLAGRRTDMPQVYAELDIMVLPSRTEGLPIALLEGLASSLPVVATAVGSVPNIVQDQRTGLLVPPEDPAALAAAILTLLRDTALRDRLAAAGHDLVAAQYSAQRMTAEYLSLYQEVTQA